MLFGGLGTRLGSLGAGLGTGGGVRPSNSMVGADGDSRTIQGQTAGNQFTRSYIHWLRSLSSQRINTRAGLNLGVSGQRSDQVLARVGTSIATLQAGGAGSVLLLVGTNDIGVLTLSQSQANIGGIIDAYRAAGIVVIGIAETPRGDLSGANLTHHEGIRDYYLSRHNPATGIYVVNTWTALAAANNRVADQVHLSVKGCKVLGGALNPTLEALFPAPAILPADNSEYVSGALQPGINVLSNALMSGGATVATGWSVTNNAGGTVAVTSSKVTTATGDWQQVAITGTPSGAGELFVRLEQVQDARAALFGSGDVLDGMVEYEVDDGIAGVRSFGLFIVTDNNPRDGDYDAGATTSDYLLPPGGYAGVMRIVPPTLSVTPTMMRMRIRAVGLTGVPMGITFRVRKAKIAKL